MTTPNKKARIPANEGRLTKILQLYVFCVSFIYLVPWMLRFIDSQALNDNLIESGVYCLFLIPLVIVVETRTISKLYWRFSAAAWIGIPSIAFAQVLFESGDPLSPTSGYRAFAALAVSPLFEELLRAAMIGPLVENLGIPFGVAITVLSWAILHEFFWIACVQQLLLCILFLWSRRSLPTNIAAHFVMNVIAVWHISLHTIGV